MVRKGNHRDVIIIFVGVVSYRPRSSSIVAAGDLDIPDHDDGYSTRTDWLRDCSELPKRIIVPPNVYVYGNNMVVAFMNKHDAVPSILARPSFLDDAVCCVCCCDNDERIMPTSSASLPGGGYSGAYFGVCIIRHGIQRMKKKHNFQG